MSEAGETSASERLVRRRRRLGLVGAFACYLLLSFLWWWHAWATHPSSVTVCGCEDPSLTTWFLAWPAYALSHGHSLLYSRMLFHPRGVNLLSNTGALALGVPFAPVTLLFGPIATLNVVSTIVPALSAVSMFWLLRRFGDWWLGAFTGGLVFAFSPFALNNLAVGHVHLVALFMLPLAAGCLDELVNRQKRSALVTGLALGLVIAVQFFLSTELLVTSVMAMVLGLALAAVYGAIAHREMLSAKAPHALRGLGVAAGVSACLLAYPAWFALGGPASFSGLVWPSPRPSSGGLSPGNVFFHLRYSSRGVQRYFAGYLGPGLPHEEYLGPGLLAVAIAGALAFPRERRLWLSGALGAILLALAMGVRRGVWTPWRLLASLPIFDNVLPLRLIVLVAGCLAVMQSLVLDRVWRAAVVARHRHERGVSTGDPSRGALGARLPARCLAAAIALVLAAAALVPIGLAEAGNVPLTMGEVDVPTWFATVARNLPPRSVLLTFPMPTTVASPLTWQAVDKMSFSLATGSGPGAVPKRAGPGRAGQVLLTRASSLFASYALPGRRNLAAVREALAAWGVSEVVVLDPSELVPRYDGNVAFAWALGFFTLALGRPPHYKDGAWLFEVARIPGPLRGEPARSFERCTGTASLRPFPLSALMAVPACVEAAVAR